MPDLHAQLLAAFEVEHRDHVEAIRRWLAKPDGDFRDIFRRAHSLKGAARAVGLAPVEHLAHQLEELFARLMAGESRLDAPTIEAIQVALDAIESRTAAGRQGQAAPPTDAADAALANALTPRGSGVRAEPPAAGPAAAAGLPAPEYVRLDAAAVADLTSATTQLLDEVQNQQATTAELRRLAQDMRNLGRLWSRLDLPQAGRDGLRAHEFAAGLANAGKGLAALAQRQARARWSLDMSAARLREGVDHIALTPAELLLGDLGRMVRQLAREYGVEADVRIEGLELRAERRVLQALRDPLIHLLRNAVSHGAEAPGVRRAAAKPDRMTIGLRLATRGGGLEARVYDDGAGPDLQRIEAAAVECGLLPPLTAEASRRSPEEVLAAAFEAGVTAAAAVDRLSGRGMGLSIVAETVRALGGTVRMVRRQPAGTEVVIAAPLSASRQAVVLAQAGGALYALPSLAIRRLLRLDPQALEIVQGVRTARIALDGSEVLAPVVPLISLLADSPADLPTTHGMVTAVLLVLGDRRLALAVEALREVEERAVEALHDKSLDHTLVIGAVICDDNIPVVVLNPETLLERWSRNQRRLAAASIKVAQAAASEPPRAKSILVVDDSITTRTLQKSILEGQGYRVHLAVDGIDALNALRSGDAVIDLVVADIEMPRMDGLALLQALKADAGLAHLPVVIMTSRETPADVRRGMELGAEAYITKQKFDQRELLATIARLL